MHYGIRNLPQKLDLELLWKDLGNEVKKWGFAESEAALTRQSKMSSPSSQQSRDHKRGAGRKDCEAVTYADLQQNTWSWPAATVDPQIQQSGNKIGCRI